MKSITCENFELNEDDLLKISRWIELSKQLAEIKKTEFDLRCEVSAIFMPNEQCGSRKYKLFRVLDEESHPLNYILKLEKDVNISFDLGKDDEFAENWEFLFTNDVPVDDVFVSKLSFSRAGYNKLTREQRELVDRFITCKPATPVIKLIEEKGELSD